MVYEMAEEAKSGEGGPDTKEAEALAAALNHSAERVQTLWFSFLTFMIYLAVATGTTTHRMLFLESPLNLPVLNIALPLLGFYILTPIIFVVFHFYMLLNFVLLARTAKSFRGCAGACVSGGWRCARKFSHAHRKHACSCSCWSAAGWSAKGSTPGS